MITKYLPCNAETSRIMHRHAVELHRQKKHMFSMWYYNSEDNSVVICTNYPGYWIGPMGSYIDALREELNAVIDKHNEFLRQYYESRNLTVDEKDFTPRLDHMALFECEV